MNKYIKTSLDQLINLVKSDQFLKNLITGIFYNIPSNQSYPYIHLNNITIKNYPIKDACADEVNFELSIFAKANDYAKLVNISEQLNQLINNLDLTIISSKISLVTKATIIENKIVIKMIISGDEP